MTNPLQQYLKKHGHAPRARLTCGSRQRLIVDIHEGYVEIRQMPSGALIYIPSDTWHTLLKWVVPLSRLQGEPFDVDQAMHDYLEEDNKYAEELAKQKRERRGKRPKRKRRRR